MKKWLVVWSMLSLCACLDEPNNSAQSTFDSDSGTIADCDDCHVQMPPPTAPHNETHNFLACNNENCHGSMVNEDGSLASSSDARHNNHVMDAACTACHEKTVFPDSDAESNFTCAACHQTPPADMPHNETHAQFACNDPNCHGAMVNDDGTAILDVAKHMDDAATATCDNCHGETASCTACHQTPPTGAPHTDGNHIIFKCNSPDCHGAMVNEDGTAILDDTKHMDGKSEIQDLSCGAVSVCHGV
ncbi:MAG: hypothetical protein JXX29_17525 [Deltaproteobacteria bacterium]|nr:hypothetical protein [Deltaproteobacteria bacterium]MBN2673485.1 hypothetical protein [Deltaproteobacteria bacterium]